MQSFLWYTEPKRKAAGEGFPAGGKGKGRKTMKLLVASDLHGSAPCCEAVLNAFAREQADTLVLLGDLLYHGPRNPLPEGYDPKRCYEMLNAFSGRILCARGNCDAAIDTAVLDFPVTAESLLFQLGGRTVFATHGDLWNEEHPPRLRPGDILLTGHFHTSVCTEHPSFVYMNPGSPALPKDEGHRGYLVLTEEEAVWKDLSGTVYRRYRLG